MRPALPSYALRTMLCLSWTVAVCNVLLSQSPAAGRLGDPGAAGKHEIRLRAVDAENRPLPGVTVDFSVVYRDESGKEQLTQDKLPTDEQGVLVIGLPGKSPSLRLWAWKTGYATVFANWEAGEIEEHGKPIPGEFTLRLLPVVSAGGRIVDEEGQPIAGVRVEVELADGKIDFPVDSPLSYSGYLAWGKAALTTDANGRWQVANLPKFSRADLKLFLSHPDFILPHAQNRIHREISVKRDDAIRGEAVVSMKRGNVVTGKVTDAEGNPIENALVIVGDDPGWARVPSKFTTDADGRFRLPAMPTAHTTLTVIAPNFAPQMRKLMVSPDLPPQYFRLDQGESVTVRVVDGKNQPIPDAVVHIESWNYSRSIATMQAVEHPPVPDTGIPRRTNAEGIWEWKSAPKGKLTLRIYAKGFDEVVRELGGETREATVKLTPPHRITVKAVDAVTGQPIPRFTALLVVHYGRRERLSAQRSSAVEGSDGRAEIIARPFSTADPLRVRVEAVGYRTQDGPDFQPGDDSPRTLEFRLRPSPPVVGIVHDPAGKPLPKARVVMATSSELGEMEYRPYIPELRAYTDDEGRFALPDPGSSWAIAVSHPEGHAYLRRRAGENDVGVLRLEPWAKVRGRFFDGGKPVARAVIDVQPIEEEDPSLPQVDRLLQVSTDEAGRFEFDRVPPGLAQIRVYLGPWSDFGVRSGPAVPLDLKPGQTVELNLGEGGVIVSGKVQLTGNVPRDLDCTYSLNYLINRKPSLAPPKWLGDLGFDLRRGWQESWMMDQRLASPLSFFQYWFVKLEPDGKFRISGVPPGEYYLSFEIYAKPEGCLVHPLGRRSTPITITDEDAKRGTLTLPELAIHIDAIPEVGDTPDFSFRRSDGSNARLADLRGRFTLVHFWASWCGPCKKDMPELKRAAKEWGDKLQVLGVAVKDDEESWAAALATLQLPWLQGRTETAVPGVSTVPTYWLLDSDGKLLFKSDLWENVIRALKEKSR